MFLPFDLDAFQFFSKDPGNRFRARSRSGIPRTEPMVRSFSSLFISPEARELIAGWYGGDLFAGSSTAIRAERLEGTPRRDRSTGSSRSRLPDLPHQLCAFVAGPAGVPEVRHLRRLPSAVSPRVRALHGNDPDARGGADGEGVLAVHGRPHYLGKSQGSLAIAVSPHREPRVDGSIGSAYSCRAPSSPSHYVISRMADLQSKPDADTPGPG